MGNGLICNNYIQQYLFTSSGDKYNFEYNKNAIHEINQNNLGNKTTNILPNILENYPENGANKRYSYFNDFDKNLRINNNDANNNSFNDTSYINRKSIDNDEIIKKRSSVYNSSNYNGSTILRDNSKRKNNVTIEEKEDNIDKNINIKMNTNNIWQYTRHNTIMKRIKENKIELTKDDIYNLEKEVNNPLKSRGSSFLNYKPIEKFESNTPKMKNEKGNFFNSIDKSVKSQFYNNIVVTKEFKISFNMNQYSEEVLSTINFIRTNPEGFLRHIDYLINNIKNSEEGIFYISQEIDEKIKLMDNYMEMFENAKNILKEKINTSKKLEKIEYNKDLEIILDESNIDYEEIEEEEKEEEEKEKEEEKKEEEKEEEKEENDFKNIPNKLNYMSDDSIIIDDEIEENDINKEKYNENSNIIDFDLEEKSDLNKSDDLISINDNKKLIIPIIKINNKKIKVRKKRKTKNKNNINHNLDLKDDDIANLILSKRKEIKKKYPLNIFKISVIKDIKMNILIQIAMEEFQKTNNLKTLKDIIFDENYKYFALSWANEINRNFISISCFA